MARRILVLYCCAGGGSRGYEIAGLKSFGVDIAPQKNYPYPFLQCDALAVLRMLLAGERLPWVDKDTGIIHRFYLDDFCAIHASPPCQAYSKMSNCRPGLANDYPRLIEPTRNLLGETRLPYVIENVVGAPLNDPTVLCGMMFKRELYRHRLFESNVPIPQPEPNNFLSLLPLHHECGFSHIMPASKAGHWKPGTVMSVAGHVSPMWKAREVMEIDWTTRDELGEAVPPYYTEYVGRHLLEHLYA